MKFSENTRLGEPHHIGTIGDLCLRILEARSNQNITEKLIRSRKSEQNLGQLIINF